MSRRGLSVLLYLRLILGEMRFRGCAAVAILPSFQANACQEAEYLRIRKLKMRFPDVLGTIGGLSVQSPSH